MALSTRKKLAFLNYNLPNIKKGIHWNDDLSAAVKEKRLFENPDAKEKDVEVSKQQIAQLPITAWTKRDFQIEYMNPRHELAKYTQSEDAILPFDKGPPSLMRPYDHEARQQVNLLIQARQNGILEEGKYEVTLENQKDRANAQRSKEMRPDGQKSGSGDPGLTPAMAAELNYHSLMETTSTL